MTTFEVDNVDSAKYPLPVAKDMLELVTTAIGVKPESCSKPLEDLSPVKFFWPIRNSLLEAVHTSYDKHYPLTLSPDIIWQCVAQGFAIHVNKNAEKLRHMFVTHREKKKLKVRRDDFVKGSSENDWEKAFGAFSDEIRENIGDDIHGLLTPDFSTTGPVEKAASQVVLMNTFKEYFNFEASSFCGIPSVTLEGSVEDWEKISEKTLSLSRFDFQQWTDAVKPILDEFVNASSGVVNKKFWQSLYKLTDMSGGPCITGWIVALFPYIGSRLEDMRPNPYLLSWGRGAGPFSGITTKSIPPGAVSTPFTWQYYKEELEMYFYAGFLGVGQDKKTLALKPLIGWAVVGKEEEEKSKMGQRMCYGLPQV